MYSTIFSNHPTVIKHPTPQPVGLGVHPDAAKAFALTNEATNLAEHLKKGSYAVPVVLHTEKNSDINFVQSKENILKKERENNQFKEVDQSVFLKDNMNKDVNLFMDNLENKKDKTERIRVCKNNYLDNFLSVRRKEKIRERHE